MTALACVPIAVGLLMSVRRPTTWLSRWADR